MKYKILFLIFASCYLNTFGSDAKSCDSGASECEHKSTGSSRSTISGSASSKPKLGLLISQSDLESCVHKHFEGKPAIDVSARISDIAGKAMVFLDDLFANNYKDSHTKTRYPYWVNTETGASYGVEDNVVLENGIGYDADIVRRLLDSSSPESIGHSDSHRYTDKSRHILKKCGHPFHAGCLQRAILQDPRCPSCRTSVKLKDSVFDYRYNKGEECAICRYSIVPSPVVAPIGSRFFRPTVGGGSAGAGGPSTGSDRS